MLRLVQLLLCLVLIIILQVSILPAYLDEAFKPNLIIILVCFQALRGESTVYGALLAYLSGLLHGVYSGFYFGLSGISTLLIYLLLRKVSDQLYTESTHLLVFSVLLASITDSIVSLIIITLVSASSGIYRSILTYMIPQAVMTAAIVAVFSSIYGFMRQRFTA